MRVFLILTIVACALALEYNVMSIADQKESYQVYLKKVIGFFNESSIYPMKQAL